MLSFALRSQTSTFFRAIKRLCLIVIIRNDSYGTPSVRCTCMLNVVQFCSTYFTDFGTLVYF